MSHSGCLNPTSVSTQQVNSPQTQHGFHKGGSCRHKSRRSGLSPTFPFTGPPTAVHFPLSTSQGVGIPTHSSVATRTSHPPPPRYSARLATQKSIVLCHSPIIPP